MTTIERSTSNRIEWNKDDKNPPLPRYVDIIESLRLSVLHCPRLGCPNNPQSDPP